MELKEKRVLISGASDGIGKSIALGLDAAGAHVTLLARNEDKLNAVLEMCGGEADSIVCDITDFDDLEVKISDYIDKNEVDILINNAGIWHEAGDLESVDDEQIHKVISTNMTAHILLTKKLLPHMRERETAIVNIISKAGVFAGKGLSVYSASKYGMRGFTDVLREDTKNEPIRVSAVYQAGTNTNMFKKSGQELSTEQFTDPQDLAEVIRFILAQPEKIWLKEVHVEY